MSQTVGPNSPGTVIDDAGVGSFTWSNPGNAAASDNARATVSINSTGGISHYLKATNFGFAIPGGATILGILVELELRGSDSDVVEERVRIVKGGVIGATERATGASLPLLTDAVVSFGGDTDLWGETWTPADIIASGFGAAFAAQSNDPSPPEDAEVDHIRVSVTYDIPVVGSGGLLLLGVG